VSATFAMNNAGIFYSPYGWWFDGSTYVETNSSGSYYSTVFTGTSYAQAFDVSPNAPQAAGNYPYVSWSIDHAPWQGVQLTSSTTSVTLGTGLASGSHAIKFWVTATVADDRWLTPVSVVRLTQITLDTGGTLTLPSTLSTLGDGGIQPGNMLVYGASVDEGDQNLGATSGIPSNQDSSQSYAVALAWAFGCELGLIAYGGQGWIQAGIGNVPAFANSWSYYYNGVSRLVGGLLSPPPNYIIISEGQLDSGLTSGEVASTLQAIAAAAPNAKIFVLCWDIASVPNTNILQQGVIASGLPNAYFINTGTYFVVPPNFGTTQQADYVDEGGHWRINGHAIYGPIVAQQMGAALATPAVINRVTNQYFYNDPEP